MGMITMGLGDTAVCKLFDTSLLVNEESIDIVVVEEVIEIVVKEEIVTCGGN